MAFAMAWMISVRYILQDDCSSCTRWYNDDEGYICWPKTTDLGNVEYLMDKVEN
jgi:hypothetical protein